MTNKTAPYKIGFGIDAHQFSNQSSDQKPLYLGGVLIENHTGLEAHSDGDVVLHSICDALLGALALDGISDIGDLFPDSDAQYKNMPSKNFVFKVLELIHSNRFKIANVDVSIAAQSPKLKDKKQKMKLFVASLLQVNANQINIKATTTEKMDAVGQGQGIYCYSVCLLYPSD